MNTKFLSIIISFIFILTAVNAVLIDSSDAYFVEVSSVQLRSDYDSYWSNSVTANDNDSIDIRAEIFLDYYNYYADHYSYYDWVEAYAEIYGYDNGWVYLRKTDTRTISLNYLNYQTIYWYNAFFIDDSYSKYKILVKARTTDYYSSSQNTAYVDTVNSGFDSYCSDIEIYNNSVAMNENSTEYISFNVKNNSNERFYIKGVSPTDSESFFGVFSYSNDSSIAAGDTGQVRLRVVSSEVNEDRTGTATLRILGEYSSGKSCGYSDIKEDFIVRIYNSEQDQSCSKIRISASDQRMQENDVETFSFDVRNDSDTGFYIDSFDAADNSSYFDATEEYKPSFIPANSSREFTYRVKTNSVSGDKTGTVYLRVSGHYSGGKTCSYTSIGEKRVNLTVEDSSGTGYCDDLYLNTKTLNLNENDSYSAVFSVENNSDAKFYIEDASLEESSTALSFTNINFPSYISANSERDVIFQAKTFSVSSAQNLTAYFKVKGYFENGRSCSLSDTRKSFSVKISNQGSGNENCNGIDVITKTVELNKGETKDFDFTIENNENKKFYIENIRVYDNTTGIDSSARNYSSVVNANSTATMTASIKGINTGTSAAFIEIRGHFENGLSCSVNDIGRETFNVSVGETDSCSGFSLDVPTAKSIMGQEEITLKIDNPLNKTGTIKLSGTNLSISPYTIDVPANYSFSKTIKVELLEGTESYLVYNISMQGCNVKSKTTKITSSQESFELMNYPSKKTISLDDSISFTIKNNSGSAKEFNVSIENLPSGWKTNEKTISVPAYGDRTASIDIQAGSTGKFNVLLVIESGARRIEKEIELTSEEKAVSVSAETTQGILNELQLKILIENNSSEQAKGNIIVELPENWSMEGNTAVSVEPETKKEIQFSVKTDGKNKDKPIPITLELDSGKKVFTESEQKTGTGATALASLVQNTGVALGLLVIIVIVVILLVKKQ
ncbi:MAG: hypothetical protein ABH986_04450 [archaeon]